ncbi:MAG: hypothetical protein JSW41_04840 [Candidatus Aenigmatarchaeota archaeon]|nr:MAG: hypothetical protein JSW41_04840 [Candidatus Aenigmarchaeota archaeon]
MTVLSQIQRELIEQCGDGKLYKRSVLESKIAKHSPMCVARYKKALEENRFIIYDRNRCGWFKINQSKLEIGE